MNNITFFDFINSYKIYCTHKINYFLLYKRKFKNYFNVVLNVLRKNYPIKGIFRNRKTKEYNHYYEILNDIFDMNYDYQNDRIHIPFKNDKKIIQLTGCKDNGDIVSVFQEEEYKFLPVKNKVVIDIGANVADTSIYFALGGAQKIIALEPFPENYYLAKKNIELNNLSEKINIILGGCSSKNGFLKSNHNGDIQKIPLYTIEKILELNKIDSGILKIDCEGCEYDIILSASMKTLRKFSHIQIEYHHGYLDLKNKLEKCGFIVRYSSPRFATHFYLNNTTLSVKSVKKQNNVVLTNENHIPRMYIGMIYATRK